jgi:hypothetical protein
MPMFMFLTATFLGFLPMTGSTPLLFGLVAVMRMLSALLLLSLLAGVPELGVNAKG